VDVLFSRGMDEEGLFMTSGHPKQLGVLLSLLASAFIT